MELFKLITRLTEKNVAYKAKKCWNSAQKSTESAQECWRCKIVLQKCRKSAQRNQDMPINWAFRRSAGKTVNVSAGHFWSKAKCLFIDFMSSVERQSWHYYFKRKQYQLKKRTLLLTTKQTVHQFTLWSFIKVLSVFLPEYSVPTDSTYYATQSIRGIFSCNLPVYPEMVRTT